jgi:hypothetical protein
LKKGVDERKGSTVTLFRTNNLEKRGMWHATRKPEWFRRSWLIS